MSAAAQQALAKLRLAIERIDAFADEPDALPGPDPRSSIEVVDGNEYTQLDTEGEDGEDSLFCYSDLRALLDLQEAEKPVNPDPYLAMLDKWQRAKDQLAAWKETEGELRALLFAGAFPNPKEGTNTFKLIDGRTIKGKYTVNRKVDEAAAPACLQALREHGVANTDQIIKYKPELSKSEWNTLSDEMKLVLSPAIIATPGTPALEVVEPKAKAE